MIIIPSPKNPYTWDQSLLFYAMCVVAMAALCYLITFLAILVVEWRVHIEMTSNGRLRCGGELRCASRVKISFKEFLEEYNKQNWRRNNGFPDGHFGDEHGGYIHASIVIMDYTRRYFGFLDHCKFRIWEKQNRLP